MTIIIVDGFSFEFKNAKAAFKFDETNKGLSTYHGVISLKAVDIVAEFENYYLFVEIKDYTRLSRQFDDYTGLKNSLKYKFRDTFLYRYAENKIDKPIRYICLLNGMDNVSCKRFCKDLNYELPVGVKNKKRWQYELVESCFVVNLDRWNKNFPDWYVQKITNPNSNNNPQYF
ncbi:MAG: hypothetical protein LBU34_09240 [Planctomycetaceae bacterium]|jgi:hypothetical protein|nr:hypothetical protein [Planctomycetaceae bacterium]